MAYLILILLDATNFDVGGHPSNVNFVYLYITQLRIGDADYQISHI